jgi:hypothetical protein
MTRSTIAYLACTLLLASCAPPEQADDETSASASTAAVMSTVTRGDWSGFPGGQCLAAVQGFYQQARFKGATVPIAGSAFGSCAAHGACLIWLRDRPDPAKWERVEPGTGQMPSTYDLIVFKESGGAPYGHIASVDHVEGNTIYVMDANYTSPGQKAPAPHTVSMGLYGWYHLKSSGPSTPKPEPPAPPPPPSGGDTGGTDDGAAQSCVPNGTYCGTDKVAGDRNTLYRCNADGASTTIVEACANGCVIEPAGKNDHCE